MRNCYFLLGFTIVSALGSSCKPLKTINSGSDLDAIVAADGSAAFSLLPVRLKYERKGNESANFATAVENAIRLNYAIVQCSGGSAAATLDALERAGDASETVLQRDGTRLVNAEGAGNCRIVGPYLMSAMTLVKIIAKISNKPADADLKIAQIVWLAARGSHKNPTLSGAFYAYLAEGIGAGVNGSDAARNQAVKNIDALFNPCDSPASGPITFDKNNLFTCVNDNYTVNAKNNSFGKTLEDLVARIAQETQSLHSQIATLPAGHPDVVGLAVGFTALSKAGDIKEIPVVAPTTSAPPGQTVSALVRLVLPDIAAVETLFGVAVGSFPESVMHSSNPNQVAIPPDSTTKTTQQSAVGFGLAAAGGDVSHVNKTADGPPELDKNVSFANPPAKNYKIPEDGWKWGKEGGNDIARMKGTDGTDYAITKQNGKETTWAFNNGQAVKLRSFTSQRATEIGKNTYTGVWEHYNPNTGALKSSQQYIHAGKGWETRSFAKATLPGGNLGMYVLDPQNSKPTLAIDGIMYSARYAEQNGQRYLEASTKNNLGATNGAHTVINGQKVVDTVRIPMTANGQPISNLNGWKYQD